MAQVNSKSRKAMGDSTSSNTTKKVELVRKLPQIEFHIYMSWILCVFIGSIALIFNLYRLGSPSIWQDEAYSVEISQLPLSQLWRLIFGPIPNMEIYYLFLHGWLRFTVLLGLQASEFVVRFPSAVFAALSTIVVFLMGKRFLGMTTGIVGAILYLLNPLQLAYAQTARSYSLQLLLLCIAWYAFFTALTIESNQKRWWTCYIFFTTLAIYAHLFSLLIVSAQVLFVGCLLVLPGPWREKTRARLLLLLISFISIGILIIPVLVLIHYGFSIATSWIPIPHLIDIYTFFLIISYSKHYLVAILICVSLGLLVSWLAYLTMGASLLTRIYTKREARAKKVTIEDRSYVQRRVQKCSTYFSACPRAGEAYLTWLRQVLPVAFAMGCWLVVPIVVSYISSQVSIHLFLPRYLVTILPPLFLLVGLGVEVLNWRLVQVVVTIGLVLFAFYGVPAYYKNAEIQEWRTGSVWLEKHYHVGDGLVCYDNERGCQISIEYYLLAYPSAAHFTEDAPGESSWSTFLKNPTQDYNAAVDPKALTRFASKHPHIFFIVGPLPFHESIEITRANAAISWLNSHYQLVAQVTTRPVTIYMYATTGGS